MNQKRAKEIKRKTRQTLKRELETGSANYLKALQSGTLKQRIKKSLQIIFRWD